MIHPCLIQFLSLINDQFWKKGGSDKKNNQNYNFNKSRSSRIRIHTFKLLCGSRTTFIHLHINYHFSLFMLQTVLRTQTIFHRIRILLELDTDIIFLLYKNWKLPITLSYQVKRVITQKIWFKYNFLMSMLLVNVLLRTRFFFLDPDGRKVPDPQHWLQYRDSAVDNISLKMKFVASKILTFLRIYSIWNVLFSLEVLYWRPLKPICRSPWGLATGKKMKTEDVRKKLKRGKKGKRKMVKTALKRLKNATLRVKIEKINRPYRRVHDSRVNKWWAIGGGEGRIV